MPSYFPSKKVFVVGMVAVVLLAWTALYTKNHQQVAPAISDNILHSVAHADSVFPDTDQDGLYNWEETLFGTDPNNPDSDSNGIPDGEQYKDQKNNIELQLSDSIYTAVNRLGEDTENTPDPIELLSTEPIRYIDPFSREDIQIIEDSATTTREYYKIQALKILSEHEEVLNREPTELIKEWVQTKNMDTFNEILVLSNQTKQIVHNFLQIDVPHKYTQIHLEIANNLFLSAVSLEDTKTTTLDPMSGFFATANYINYMSKYISAVFSLGEE